MCYRCYSNPDQLETGGYSSLCQYFRTDPGSRICPNPYSSFDVAQYLELTSAILFDLLKCVK